LAHKAKGFSLERILLPLGNDFYNVDNTTGTTTKGTRQDEDGRWQKSFVRGKVMTLQAIEELSAIAPVDVVMVPGNHDTERLFYLGEVLSAYFARSKRVSVNNEPTKRKYFRYGHNLIGFTHGNEERKSNLPLIMASEMAQDWSETTYREWHTGHFHSKTENHFQPVKERIGVRERIIPSLTPADAWHKGMGYQGLRAAEAYVWRKSGGCEAVLSYFPE
jgi:predicted phosphodiesterase